MKIARHNIFLFFAILSAPIGSCFFYDWSIEKVDMSLRLLNFSPSAIFFIIYILEKKYGSKKKIQSINHLIILFTIVPYMLFMYIMNSFIPIEYGIRNPRKYSSIVANKWDKDLVHHFPREIPNNAKDVKFFYRAGTVLRLSYSTTPEEINKLCDRFSRTKIKLLNKKSSKDYKTISFDWIPKEWVPTEKERKRRGLSINTSSNHARRHGVSIDKKRNTIVYWAETW